MPTQSHHADRQTDRKTERERDVHDFLVNPSNKNVYFVRMSVRYKTPKGGNQSHALDHHVFWTAAAQLLDKT